MALDSIVFSNELEDGYKKFIGVDGNGVPVAGDDGMPVPSQGNYEEIFADAIEAHSLTGEVPGAEHGNQDKTIIEDFIASFSDNSSGVIEFATALANYWATVLIVPGSPAHGGVEVTDVVNDAANRVSAFEDAITASITQEYKYPWMEHFIINVESIALPQVIWTVTELMSDGTTQTFTETVF